MLHISIEYPVGLPGEQDGVHPQAQHEQDDQHLPKNLSLDINHFKFKGFKLLFGDRHQLKSLVMIMIERNKWVKYFA